MSNLFSYSEKEVVLSDLREYNDDIEYSDSKESYAFLVYKKLSIESKYRTMNFSVDKMLYDNYLKESFNNRSIPENHYRGSLYFRSLDTYNLRSFTTYDYTDPIKVREALDY